MRLPQLFRPVLPYEQPRNCPNVPPTFSLWRRRLRSVLDSLQPTARDKYVYYKPGLSMFSVAASTLGAVGLHLCTHSPHKA